MKDEEDKFGIAFGTLMIIGTLLPYMSFLGVELLIKFVFFPVDQIFLLASH